MRQVRRGARCVRCSRKAHKPRPPDHAPPEAPAPPQSAPPLWTSAQSSRAGASPPPLTARSRPRCAGKNHPGSPPAPLLRPRQGSGRTLPSQVRGPRAGPLSDPGASRSGAGRGCRWEGPGAGHPWAPGRRRRGGWGLGAEVGRGPGPVTLWGRPSGPQPAGLGPPTGTCESPEPARPVSAGLPVSVSYREHWNPLPLHGESGSLQGCAPALGATRAALGVTRAALGATRAALGALGLCPGGGGGPSGCRAPRPRSCPAGLPLRLTRLTLSPAVPQGLHRGWPARRTRSCSCGGCICLRSPQAGRAAPSLGGPVFALSAFS